MVVYKYNIRIRDIVATRIRVFHYISIPLSLFHPLERLELVSNLVFPCFLIFNEGFNSGTRVNNRVVIHTGLACPSSRRYDDKGKRPVDLDRFNR